MLSSAERPDPLEAAGTGDKKYDFRYKNDGNKIYIYIIIYINMVKLILSE